MEVAQKMASASAWRGIVVLTFFDKANTTFPLQSLATTVIEEKDKPTTASQLNFKVPGRGTSQGEIIFV